jgi:hypothetical protein
MDDLEFLFVDEPPLEPDDSENHLGNEPDLPDVPGGDATIREPIHRTNSRYLRNKLGPEELVKKVKAVLAAVRTEGLNLPIFLDAVCWGDPQCIADATVRYARTSLMTSEELPGIIERCYNPPRPVGERPGGGRQVLFDFAVQCVSDAIDREMKISAPLFLSPPEELSEEHLTSLDFEALKVQVQTSAPNLWLIFRRAAYTPLQEARNKHKHPDMVGQQH